MREALCDRIDAIRLTSDTLRSLPIRLVSAFPRIEVFPPRIRLGPFDQQWDRLPACQAEDDRPEAYPTDTRKPADL